MRGMAQVRGPSEGASPSLVKPRHFGGFDGLRAIAAVSILVLHTGFSSGFTARSTFGIYTSRLEIGVSVFFLISGFLLYRPFAISHLAGRPSPNSRRFWERRLLRIVPAYWLALTLLTYVFHLVQMGPGWQQVVIHYGFLQIYFPTAVFFGIPQAWSVCTEMSFYLFLPIYAAAVGFRRRAHERQLVREVVGLSVLVIVSFLFRWWSLYIPFTKIVNGQTVGTCYPNCLTHAPFSRLMVNWLPARLDLFAAGMLLAVLSAWWSEHGAEPSWLARRWMPWVAWAGAACAYWATSHLGIPTTPLFVATPVKAIVMQTLYAIFAFLLLLPAVFGPEGKGLVRRFLGCWPVASLGVISYGIYLWHLNLIDQVLSWTGWVAGACPYWELVLAVMGITVVAASISYFGLERPVLKLKGRLGWWSRPTSAPSADESVLTE